MAESNKVKNFSDEKLKEIAERVVTGFDEDLESRADFDKNNETAYKLFQGVRESRCIPHLGDQCANIVVPLITIAALQFQARAYDSLIPGIEVLTAHAVDGKSKDAAARVTKHMNWQFMEEMTFWEEDVDKSLLMLPLLGNAFKKTYRDHVGKKNESVLLSHSEVVINYGVKHINQARRITHILRLSSSDLIEREKKGIFANVDELKSKIDAKKTGIVGTPDDYNNLEDTVNEEIGFTPPTYLDDTKRKILEQHCWLDLDDDGIEEPYIVTVDYDLRVILRISSRRYTDPVTRREETYNHFTHYYLIPNPESLYGFGFGLLLGHLNEAINSIVNELIDAGNLNNMQSGFINSRALTKRGELQFRRGELKEVDGRSGDLQKDIFLFDFKPPSQALFALLGLLYGYGKEISSISDAMIGKLPPSDTAATSFMAVLEQGLKMFSVIHKRVHRVFKLECKKLFTLNKLYLDEKVYAIVQDSTSSEWTTLETGKADYQNNIDIRLVSDPTIISKAEKVAKATQLYTLIRQDPLTKDNQVAQYESLKQLLIAQEVQSIDIYLPPKENLKPAEFSPIQENSRFIQELSSPVLPNQNHTEHMQIHQAFFQGQFGQLLTSQGRAIYDDHMKQTLAAMYEQFEQQQSQMRSQPQMMGNQMGGFGV